MNTVSSELLREVEQFLFHEARLLDERRFEEWLELFSEDAHYWMPIVSTRERGNREVATERELAYFDDTKETLRYRVKRLYTGLAWAEEPPSRTCRFLSNIQVEQNPDASLELSTRCNLMVYRTRLETDRDLFIGTREDVLRRVNDTWQVARRRITLTESVLDANNLSIFF